MSFFQYLWLNPETALLIYLLFINLWLFLAMAADKSRAKKQKPRIPEAKLFLLALLGGSPGGIAGIYCFRHKTKHKSFVIGLPAILAVELALTLFIVLL